MTDPSGEHAPEIPPSPSPSTEARKRLLALAGAAALAAIGLALAAGRRSGPALSDSLAGHALWVIVVGFAGCLYFAPTLVAWRRGHRDVLAIGALNLFLGWSFVGWVIALVWSLRASDRATR